MSNSSILHIDRTQPGTTIPGRVDLGVMAMKGYSTFLKALALLKLLHQTV